MDSLPYTVLAYYIFTPIDDPRHEVALHKAFFEDKDITSRIYISEEGINGQMSAATCDAELYIEWMHSRPQFQNVVFKKHYYHEQAFPRKTVKYRKHLVGYDETVDISKTGEHVSPAKWKEMLETLPGKVLIDVRNDYEWKLGNFSGAELPPCETFREFKEYGSKLKEQVDPQKTPVMMYCTGGIRCELYSAVLKELGFDKVYQLDGGIINYGLQQGADHWNGKLFVFDDRLAVPISEDDAPVIGKCHHCQTPNETYLNCANMDCNNLFLCCPECASNFQGCCSETCKCAERVRPYHKDTAHKPFRRAHLLTERES
jgi:UPF0176 protein